MENIIFETRIDVTKLKFDLSKYSYLIDKNPIMGFKQFKLTLDNYSDFEINFFRLDLINGNFRLGFFSDTNFGSLVFKEIINYNFKINLK